MSGDICKLGETSISKNGMVISLIAYKGNLDVDVKFEDGTIVKNKSYYDFKSGNIDYPEK